MFKSVMMFELEQTMKKEKVNILDVREIDEFNEGHIPGAIHAPMSDFINQLDKINKNESYYVVCYSGSRSQVVAGYLGNNGYKAINVLGGMSSYKGQVIYEV